MNSLVKIPKAIFDQAVHDIEKPHPIAYERIGYFLATANENSSFLIKEWYSMPDEFYENSDSVGALINQQGMKFLMTLALKHKLSIFQFHKHDFQEKPTLSHVDLKSLNEIVPALFRFGTKHGHGSILLGQDTFSITIWDSKDKYQTQILKKEQVLI